MKSKITCLAVFFLLASSAFSYQTVKTFNLSADGVKKLDIDCGSGFLKVFGRDSLGEIQVEAEIILKGRSDKKAEEFIRRQVKLYLEKRGSKAVLVSKIDRRFRFFSFRSETINLTVNVPRNIALEIDDGSGSMTIEGLNGDVAIDDGSGEIQVTGIGGHLRIDDGSGKIQVNNISGDVWVDDGSGSIEIRDVGQNVTIRDGSGSVIIDGVGGDVVLSDDGSGGFRAQNVKGKIYK